MSGSPPHFEKNLMSTQVTPQRTKQDPSLLLHVFRPAGTLAAGGSIWGALLTAGRAVARLPRSRATVQRWPGCHDAQVQISVLWEVLHRFVRVLTQDTRLADTHCEGL